MDPALIKQVTALKKLRNARLTYHLCAKQGSALPKKLSVSLTMDAPRLPLTTVTKPAAA